MCQLWAARHPDRVMTIVRPTIVFGPTVNNYILRFWQTSPFFPLLDGRDPDWQFVHEDDVVEALSRLLVERRGGIFNVTADGTIKLSDAARLAGVKTRRMPTKLYKRLAAASWKLHVPNVEAPPGRSTSCSTRGSPRTRSSRRSSTGRRATRAGRRSRSRCARRAAGIRSSLGGGPAARRAGRLRPCGDRPSGGALQGAKLSPAGA